MCSLTPQPEKSEISLRATVVQADERLNATRLMLWSFPGHWRMSSKLNELRPAPARS
jgi:hypothetical protein